VLVDRREDREAIAGLLDAARYGMSRTLVLRGEAGIGKTVLLEYAIESASDFRTARVVGVESEMELGFAGLHQLLAPFLGAIDQLPDPQRAALQSAFGLVAGRAPDPFFVGLSALTLLSNAAEEQPLLCIIDDAQWLDDASAGALSFVARRLLKRRTTHHSSTAGRLARLRDGSPAALQREPVPGSWTGAVFALTASRSRRSPASR
jgi:hypothetical protein